MQELRHDIATDQFHSGRMTIDDSMTHASSNAYGTVMRMDTMNVKW